MERDRLSVPECTQMAVTCGDINMVKKETCQDILVRLLLAELVVACLAEIFLGIRAGEESDSLSENINGKAITTLGLRSTCQSQRIDQERDSCTNDGQASPFRIHGRQFFVSVFQSETQVAQGAPQPGGCHNGAACHDLPVVAVPAAHRFRDSCDGPKQTSNK